MFGESEKPVVGKVIKMLPMKLLSKSILTDGKIKRPEDGNNTDLNITKSKTTTQ